MYRSHLRRAAAPWLGLALLVLAVAPARVQAQVFFPGPDLIPSAGAPRGLAAADLDGNGRLDLVATSPESGRILVHSGDGDGGFLSPRSQLVGGVPVAIAVTDFDRDGLSDVVWVDEATGDVGAMLQRDTFPVSYELRRQRGADEPSGVLVWDFDQDGWMDVAVAQRGADQVAIYPNLQGQLGEPMTFPVGDGPSLLAVLPVTGGSELTILQTGYLSRDLTTFDLDAGQMLRRLPLEGPTWMEVGPYAGSTADRLLVLDGPPGRVHVLEPGPGATLDEVGGWDVETGSRVLRILEPSARGPRHLVGESERGSATVFLGGSDPQRESSWFVGDRIRDLVLADFDEDGAEELVCSLPGLSVLQLMRPWGDGYLAYETFRTGPSPSEIRLRRPDGPTPRVSFLCTGSWEVFSYRVEDNQLVPFESVPVAAETNRHFWIDIDGDGLEDLVTMVARAGLRTYRSNGAGFDPPVDYVVDGELRDLHALDLVGGPSEDLLVANTTLGGVLVYEGDGAGGFALVDTLTTSDAPARVRSRDLDLDGKEDLVILGLNSQVSILYRTAEGLSSPISFAVGVEPRDADFGDFNGDAYPDIIVANAGASSYSVLLSVVQGIYSPGTVNQVTPSGAGRVFATDLDANGLDDIVLSSPSSQYVAYHLNTGTVQSPTGAFSIPQRVRAAVLPLDFEFLEIDGDGRRDLLVADGLSNVAVVLRTDPSSLLEPFRLQVEGERTREGVRILLQGTAATSAEFEIRRAGDGRRLAPRPVGEGRWEVHDPAPPPGAESYLVLARDEALLGRFDAQPMEEAEGDARWRMLAPRRVDGATEIRFRVGEGLRPTVRIYDVRGREVNSLRSRDEGEGWHRAIWRGEDERGRPVARGRYFSVVRTDGITLRASILHP